LYRPRADWQPHGGADRGAQFRQEDVRLIAEMDFDHVRVPIPEEQKEAPRDRSRPFNRDAMVEALAQPLAVRRPTGRRKKLRRPDFPVRTPVLEERIQPTPSSGV